MLAIWSILAPATAHAWVVVIKNHTNELMTFCYTITEMGSGCFGSTDVPPNGTATVNMGRACAGKWRVTRARDGQVQAFSRPGGAASRRLRLTAALGFLALWLVIAFVVLYAAPGNDAPPIPKSNR